MLFILKETILLSWLFAELLCKYALTAILLTIDAITDLVLQGDDIQYCLDH
jgi:hypothetical protein